MSGITKLFGRTYNEVGNTNSDFIIKTRGLVKVQCGRTFVDVIKDGKLNVNVEVVKKVKTKADIGTSDGIYVTDNGNIYIVSGGPPISLYGEAGSTYVSFIGELDTTQEAKLQALLNLGIVFDTITDAQSKVTDGFVFIKKELKFYTVNEGEFTEYPSNDSSDTLTIDKKSIIILNIGNLVLSILNGNISISSPIISENTILSRAFIGDTFKSQSGSISKGFYVETKGDTSTLYVDYLVVRKEGNSNQEEEIPFISGNIQYSYKRNYIVSHESSEGPELEGEETEEEETTEENLILHLAWTQSYSKGDILGIYTTLEVEDEDNLLLEEAFITFTVTEDSEGTEVNVSGTISNGVSIDGKELFLIGSETPCNTRYLDLNNIDLLELNSREIHTRIGDISEYRTYEDNLNTTGIFSDLIVSIGGEFREPLSGECELLHFPRYTDTLNDNLCNTDNENLDNVIPTIRWIKQLNIISSLLIPIGSIVMWVTETPPEGWLLCDGNSFDETEYPDLYSVLNTNIIPNLSTDSINFIIKAN